MWPHFIVSGIPLTHSQVLSSLVLEPVTDYTEGVTGVLFGPSTENQMQCLTININDDEVFEPTETFTVSISSTESPLAINQLLSVATVTIFDSDGEVEAFDVQIDSHVISTLVVNYKQVISTLVHLFSKLQTFSAVHAHVISSFHLI